MNHYCTRPNETRLEQKRIKSVWARYARRTRAKTFSAKTDHLGMISFARVNSVTLFSAKVNHLIKCAFYTNTPLKRPKQETIRIFVINCMPCCNFTVNIGFLAAHEDRNTMKLQSRFLRFASARDEPLLFQTARLFSGTVFIGASWSANCRVSLTSAEMRLYQSWDKTI